MVLAESGTMSAFGAIYLRAGAFRTLTRDDAALFAVPPGMKIDPSARDLYGKRTSR
jgi:hypothetical protein